MRGEAIDSTNLRSSTQLNSQASESDNDIEDVVEEDEVFSKVNSFAG
jgi:hypothetical protein